MIDTIVIPDKSVGQAAQFEKTIPIRIVARQTRDFKTQDDSHVTQGNFADHACETGALFGARTGETEIVIDNDDLILERSVIDCLRWPAGSNCIDHQTRQRFDHELFVLVVEFLPQARLRNRDIEEVQIQLRHDSPALEQIGAPVLRRVAKEHLPGSGAEASAPASR